MPEKSEPSVLNKPMSREDFLKIVGATAIAAGLASCAPKSAVGSIGTPEAERVEYKKTLTDKPFSFTVDPEYLGATDPNDPNTTYSRAIEEGGIVQAGGARLRVTYNGGVFDEKTFLHYPQAGEELKPGDIIPQAYLFTEGTDNVVHQIKVQRYVKSMQGNDTKEITLREGAEYLVIPIVVSGTQNGITDPGNTTFESIGEGRYLAFTLLEVGSQKNTDGTWGAQVIGVVANTSSQGIFVTQDNYPDLSEYE